MIHGSNHEANTAFQTAPEISLIGVLRTRPREVIARVWRPIGFSHDKRDVHVAGNPAQTWQKLVHKGNRLKFLQCHSFGADGVPWIFSIPRSTCISHNLYYVKFMLVKISARPLTPGKK
jgi:hypothetical protein